MRILISGGCKNGKSALAQQLAKAQNPEKLFYIATMLPVDGEDAARIEAHKKSREGWGFTTIEAGKDILNALPPISYDGSYLLDSITALLSNEMFLESKEVNCHAQEKVAKELGVLLSKTRNIALVSDYIYSDAVMYDEFTEGYRRGLAYVDRQMAKACDIVVEVVYTNYKIHKGLEDFWRLYEKIS